VLETSNNRGTVLHEKGFAGDLTGAKEDEGEKKLYLSQCSGIIYCRASTLERGFQVGNAVVIKSSFCEERRSAVGASSITGGTEKRGNIGTGAPKIPTELATIRSGAGEF